jgi:Fur family ferric uptake transcriptional regulator
MTTPAPSPRAAREPQRSTRQRRAVQALLERTQTFRSAQDIYAELREQGNPIGLATVYRALQLMVDDGEVDVLRRSQDGESAYRRCRTGHHHHLVCRVCGRTVEVEDRAVEAWAREVAAEHGFTDVHHVVEVFGTCAACRAGA